MDPQSASQPLAFIKPHARFHLVSLIQLFKAKADLTLPPAEWLDAMKLGISADGELFALAHDRFLALLPRATADDPVTHLIDAKCREGEKITDLVVTTVKEDRKAWNFVILGYNTGMVRAFSESGDEVFAHCFHKAPVVRMHLASCTSAGIFAGFSENFSILYGRVLVVIVGASLYYILMTYVRMGQNATSSSPSSIDVRKIALEGLLDTTDFMSRTSIGLNDAASTAHTVITVGSNPIIAFYEAHSKQAGQNDGGLLKLVSSSLTSWWGSSKSVEPKNPLELVPVNNTRSSIALTDSVRKITSTCLAPTGHLAATADELGRVLLLDVRLNVVCRMWKGYRDAQCGWLFGCSQDEPSNQAQMFLVIYTPRRGILEVWKVRHGDRVAAFNVGTNLRLLYCSPLGPTKWKHPRCFLLRLDLTFTEVVFRAPLVSRPVTIVHVPEDEAVSSSSSSSSPSSSPPSSADNTPSDSPAVSSKIIASSTPPTTIASIARAPGSTPPNEPGSTPVVKGRPLRGLSLTKAIRVPDPRVSPRSYHHPVPPQDPTAFEIAPPSSSPERHSSLVPPVAGADTAPTEVASDTAAPPP